MKTRFENEIEIEEEKKTKNEKRLWEIVDGSSGSRSTCKLLYREREVWKKKNWRGCERGGGRRKEGGAGGTARLGLNYTYWFIFMCLINEYLN